MCKATKRSLQGVSSVFLHDVDNAHHRFRIVRQCKRLELTHLKLNQALTERVTRSPSPSSTKMATMSNAARTTTTCEIARIVITLRRIIKLALTVPDYLSVRKIAMSMRVFRGRILIFHATLLDVFSYLNVERHHGRGQNQSSTQGCS